MKQKWFFLKEYQVQELSKYHLHCILEQKDIGTWIYFGSMARTFIFGWNLDLFWVYGPYLYF